MRKFKITYIEGDTINKTKVVEANDLTEALALFALKNLGISDITKVEEVTE